MKIAEKYLEIAQRKIISLLPKKFESWQNFWGLFISTVFFFTLIYKGLKILNHQDNFLFSIIQEIIKNVSIWIIIASLFFLMILWVLAKNPKLEEVNKSDENQELLISVVYLILVSTILTIGSLKVIQIFLN